MLTLKDRLANHRILLFGAPFLLLMLLAFVSEDSKIVLGKPKLTEEQAVQELLAFSELYTNDYEFSAVRSGSIGTIQQDQPFDHLAVVKLNELYRALTGNSIAAELISKSADGRYELEYETAGVRVHASIAELAEQNQAWLTAAVTTNQSENTELLFTLKNRLDNALSSLQVRTIWSYTLQGELAQDVETADTAFIFNRIKSHWNVEEVGMYEDAGSISISYYSSLFSVLSNDRGDFQAAVHTHSETGQSRLTVGIPAIGIEY